MTYEDTWVQPNTGWICPVCGLVNAPFIPYCPCKGRGSNTYSTTSTGTDYIKESDPIEESKDDEYNGYDSFRDGYDSFRKILAERNRDTIDVFSYGW